MLERLDNVSGHPGRSNLDLAGIPRKLTFNLANLSGHPGRKMYPGRDKIHRSANGSKWDQKAYKPSASFWPSMGPWRDSAIHGMLKHNALNNL